MAGYSGRSISLLLGIHSAMRTFFMPSHEVKSEAEQ